MSERKVPIIVIAREVRPKQSPGEKGLAEPVPSKARNLLTPRNDSSGLGVFVQILNIKILTRQNHSGKYFFIFRMGE